MDVRTLAAIIATGAAVMAPAEARDALGALIGGRAAGEAPALVGRSLGTFLAVETAYKEARYEDALRDLEALWREAPPGDAKWVEASQAAGELAQSPGLNIGNPPCYYSLRMLTDCVRWRIESGSRTTHQEAPHRAVLTVVLVGRSTGVEPRSWAELEADGGVPVEHALAPELLAGDHRIIRESLWLFREYMLASTGADWGSKSASRTCRTRWCRCAAGWHRTAMPAWQKAPRA